MALRRGRNIESLLASKLEDDGSRLSDFGEQGREARVDGRRIREYFVARGKPKNYQYSPSEAREAMNYFKAVDKSKGDWEGTSSPFLQGSGSDSSGYIDPIMSEGLERKRRGMKASMEDFGDEEGGGFWNEAMGLFDSDSIGTEEKTYRDVDTEGDNRYLNKLAREEFAEKEFIKSVNSVNEVLNIAKKII